MKKMELNKEPVRVLQCTSQLSAGGVFFIELQCTYG